ncbi:MAG: NAD(P)H-dependent oxidoreductase [Burkholderiales bacterium]|nr:NAD(P)H-dependent oxidoreductase [Burkholderiales bacterium]MBW8893842.1 NAD(P)H-dependent oxidoreductase [Burkholderiales bacterium]
MRRFGEGLLKGKRALVDVQAGGPAADYGPRGINGRIEQLLFPLTHDALFYPGMDVLPTHAVYGAGHVSAAEEVDAIKAAWRVRLAGLFHRRKPNAHSETAPDLAYRRRAIADGDSPNRSRQCAGGRRRSREAGRGGRARRKPQARRGAEVSRA